MPGKKKQWIGFDLGGTKMLAAVFDDNLKKRAGIKRRTRSDDGPKDILDRIYLTIEEVLDSADLKKGQLDGIGIGVPGPIDHRKGMVLDTPNLGWKNVALVKLLEKRFDCPVRLANDVDAGVFGEYLKGAGKKSKCLLGAFPGTGLGGGCVVDGKIFQGARFSCMEIGHFPMMPQSPVWGKRQFATLESLTSRLCVSKEASVEVFRGRAPHLENKAGSDFRNYKSGALAEASEKDEVIRDILNDAAAWLGVGLAGLVNIFAPDCIVLGGGMVESMPEFFVKEVSRTLDRHVMPVYKDSFKVKAAQLGDDAAILGAAGLIRDHEG